MLTDRSVGREDGGVEVLARVVTSSASSGPLKDDGEVGVRASDVDDLADTVDASCESERERRRVSFRSLDVLKRKLKESGIPGLNETCLIPDSLNPSMISLAFSVEGIPAATQSPSTGRPSLRISCQRGSWKVL